MRNDAPARGINIIDDRVNTGVAATDLRITCSHGILDVIASSSDIENRQSPEVRIKSEEMATHRGLSVFLRLCIWR